MRLVNDKIRRRKVYTVWANDYKGPASKLNEFWYKLAEERTYSAACKFVEAMNADPYVQERKTSFRINTEVRSYGQQ